MKKAVILFSFIGILIACNSGDSTSSNNSSDSSKVEAGTPEQTAAATDPDVDKGLELIGKSDCLGCHKVVDAGIGPAYEAVAARYPDNDAVIDSLAGKIITGGSGNWGQGLMTAHPGLSKDDAKKMVKYVLSLK